MDLTGNGDVSSPSSRTHQSSFGLLDDRLLDGSWDNLGSSRIRDKPPIPNKQTPISAHLLQHQQRNQQQMSGGNKLHEPSNEDENAEVTAESIRLNESDLKELEGDFTFEEDDDDDNDQERSRTDTKSHNYADEASEKCKRMQYEKSLQEKTNDFQRDFNAKSFLQSTSYNKFTNSAYNYSKSDLTNVSSANFFDFDKSINVTEKFKLNNQTDSHQLTQDFLIDESSNVLRNSTEFDKTSTQNQNQSALNTTQSNNPNNNNFFNSNSNNNNFTFNNENKFEMSKNQISYDKMDEINASRKYSMNMFKTVNVPDDFGSNSNGVGSNLFDNDSSNNNNDFNDNPFDTQPAPRDDDPFGVDDPFSNASKQAELLGEKFNDLLADSSQFVSGENCQELFVQDEAENRKVFADNDLTLNYTNGGNSSSSGDSNPSPHWWKNVNNALQTSKLELSNVSYLSNTSTDVNPTVEPVHTKTDTSKHKIPVEVFFDKKSDLPPFLKDIKTDVDLDPTPKKLKNSSNSSSTLTETTQKSNVKRAVDAVDQDKTLCEDKEVEFKVPMIKVSPPRPTPPRDSFQANHKMPVPQFQVDNSKSATVDSSAKSNTSTNDDENITFSTSLNNTPMSASNFSFTLNTSETGEFIVKKSQHGQKSQPDLTNASPYQLAKQFPLQSMTTKSAISQPAAKKNTDLKSMQAELDQVSDRLAAAKLKTNAKNQKASSNMLSMDETISSISSKSSLKSDLELSTANNKTQAQQVKSSSKIASGSLTSTPSKMTKSASETSNLSSASGVANLMDKLHKTSTSSSNANSDQLFNQESFLSSIPERTNDSTLISSSNHDHHHHHHHHHNHHQHQRTSHHTNTTLKRKPHQSSSSASSTSSVNSSLAKGLKKAKSGTNECQSGNESAKDTSNNRISMTSVSSTNSSSSNDSSNPSQSVLSSQFNILNNLAAAMNNNSSVSSAGPLFPVAFLPLNTLNTYISGAHRFSMDEIHNSVTNKSAANGSDNYNSMFSAASQSVASMSASSCSSSLMSKFDLPQFDLDERGLDFGQIVEGCSTTLRYLIKFTNSDLLLKCHRANQISCYFQIELSDHVDWAIEPYLPESGEDKLQTKSATNKHNFIRKKFNEYNLKSKMRKTLTIHANRQSIDAPAADGNANNKIVLNEISKCYEIFLHLNTRDLNFYKELLAQMEDSAAQGDQLEPLEIRANMYIYYYVYNINNSASSCLSDTKKYLLHRLDIRYVLGYAHLKQTVSNGDRVEFDVYDQPDTNDSMNESAASSPANSEQLVTLSNAGNLPVDIECYLRFNESHNMNDDEKYYGKRYELVKFRNYELKLDEVMFNLPAKSKQRQSIKLILKTLKNQKVFEGLTNEQLASLAMVVEVKPNGPKSLIPIKITSHDKKPLRNLRMASSKSLMFFGQSLCNTTNVTSTTPDDLGLVEEVLLENSNDVKISCIVSINCLSTSVCDPYFTFASEMKKTDKLALNHDLNQLKFSLEPREQIRLKIRFSPPSSLSSSSSCTVAEPVLTGLIKVNVIGSDARYNVQLVAFVNECWLNVENSTRLPVNRLTDDETLMQQLKQLKNVITRPCYHSADLQTASSRKAANSFKKLIYLRNRSSNSRCIVLPVLFSKAHAKECPPSISTSSLTYYLTKENRLKLNVSSTVNSTNSSGQSLVWLELNPDEQTSLTLELISTSHYSSLNDFALCLFWIELEIYKFCVQAIQACASSASSSSSSSEQKFIELYLDRLASNQTFQSASLSQLPISINDSSSRLNRLASSESMSSICDQSYSSVNSSLLQIASKTKVSKNDFLKLLRHSLKCVVFSMNLNGPEKSTSSNDYSNRENQVPMEGKKTNDSSSSSQLKDMNLLLISLGAQRNNNNSNNGAHSQLDDENSSTCNEDDTLLGVENSVANNNEVESWSISSQTIVLENLNLKTYQTKADAASAGKVYVKNNLMRKRLEFYCKFRATYLSVTPGEGQLEPGERVELVVRPTKEALACLPWHGTISVWCNQIQKDIRVSLLGSSTRLGPSLPSNTKNMSNLSSESSLNTMPSSLITQSSTPYNNSINPNSVTTGANGTSNSIEQGTLISETSEHTMDSLSLTPLISASILMPPASSTFSSTASTSGLTRNSTSSNKNSTKNDESLIRIVRTGNDIQVKFPPVSVGQRKSIDLTLTNPTSNYVVWKSFSSSPALIRLSEHLANVSSELSSHNIMKSTVSVFLMTPSSGTIPPNQKQAIRIDFAPRDGYGFYSQYWTIDTRTDSTDLINPSSRSSLPTSYTCRLTISGKSVPLEIPIKLLSDLTQEDDYTSRLTNRILKSKTNSLYDSNTNSSTISESGKDANGKSTDNVKNMLKNKENSLDGSAKGSSMMASSVLSDSSKASSHRICIKEDVVKFADTPVDHCSKAYFHVNNKGDQDYTVSFLTIFEPFYLKHTEVEVKARHFIKIPIEFRPRSVGEFRDKLLVTYNKNEAPLTCTIVGRCIN